MHLCVDKLFGCLTVYMTGRKNAWTVSTSRCPPYKALENFSKALYGTTGGTYSACIIRPVMSGSRSKMEILIEIYYGAPRRLSACS